MRKTTAIITAMLLALGLAGCYTAEQGTYDDDIEHGTVCIDGYQYAYGFSFYSSGSFDMEPMGQVCEVTDDAA